MKKINIGAEEIGAYCRAHILGGYLFGYNKRKDKKNREILGKYIKGWYVPTQKITEKYKIRNRVKEALRVGEVDISGEMGIWTPSFISGIKDSGGLLRNSWKWYYLRKKWHKELLLDILDIKMPIKVSKEYKCGRVVVTGNCFFDYEGKLDKKQYLAGLFAGSRIVEMGGNQWNYMNFRRVGGTILNIKERVCNNLGQLYIPFKEYKEGIIVSPFYGALVFGNMPVNSASRAVSVDRVEPEYALIYWNMIKKGREKIAPTSKNILPFSLSYSSYFKKGIIKKEADIRKIGIEMGILGISEEIRELLIEWKRYHGEEG